MKLLFCQVSNCSSLLLLPSPSVQNLLSYIVNNGISFLSHVPHLVPSDLSEFGSNSLLKKKNLHKMHNQWLRYIFEISTYSCVHI